MAAVALALGLWCAVVVLGWLCDGRRTSTFRQVWYDYRGLA